MFNRGDRVRILGNGRKVHKDRRTGIETKPVYGDTGTIFWKGVGYNGDNSYGIKVDRTGGAIFTQMRLEALEPVPAVQDEADYMEEQHEAKLEREYERRNMELDRLNDFPNQTATVAFQEVI